MILKILQTGNETMMMRIGENDLKHIYGYPAEKMSIAGVKSPFFTSLVVNSRLAA